MKANFVFAVAMLLATALSGSGFAGSVKRCEKIKPAQVLPVEKQSAVAQTLRAQIPGVPIRFGSETKVDTQTKYSAKHLSDDELAKGWAIFQLCVLRENGTISSDIYEESMRKLFGLDAVEKATADMGPANHPNTLAVMYFDNRSGEKFDALRLGLAQMLISDLTGPKEYEIVERERLADILKELDLNKSNKIDSATAARAGKLLGAEWLLLGSFFEMMGTFRIDARLIRTETGEILHAKGVNGAAADFMSLEKELATEFASALLTQVASNEVANAAKAEIMAKKSAAKKSGKELDALIMMSTGLKLKDAGDHAGAIESLKKALALSPGLKAAERELKKLQK